MLQPTKPKEIVNLHGPDVVLCWLGWCLDLPIPACLPGRLEGLAGREGGQVGVLTSFHLNENILSDDSNFELDIYLSAV